MAEAKYTPTDLTRGFIITFYGQKIFDYF